MKPYVDAGSFKPFEGDTELVPGIRPSPPAATRPATPPTWSRATAPSWWCGAT